MQKNKIKKNYLAIQLPNYSDEEGFTLLEAIIAIAILLVGTTGAMTLISRSIVGFGISKENLIATNLAQEGLEVIHNIRDNNWLDSANPPWNDWDGDGAGNNCPSSSPPPCQGYVFADINSGDLRTDTAGTILRWNNGKNVYDDGGTGMDFYRTITITDNPDGDSGTVDVSVKSTIGWGDAGSCLSGGVSVPYQYCLTLEERLYDWR